jgi:copper oxidase (laccase) domain-containing protein
MKHLPHFRPMFGGALQSMVTPRDAGVVHPDHPEFAETVESLLEASRADYLLAQSLAMKTDVADVTSGAALEPSAVHPRFLRTKDKADAVIYLAGGIDTGTLRGKVAALMMVADSPGITVFDAERDVVAFANGSMECLDPADGSDGIVKKMVEAMKQAGSDPKNIAMVVSACARACCFGYDMSQPQNLARHARLTGNYGADVITPAILYPPRAGNGIDLGLIAKRQAELAGVDPDCVKIDELCTAHDGAPIGSAEQGRFFSGIRGAKMGAKQTPAVKWNERQALLVWS